MSRIDKILFVVLSVLCFISSCKSVKKDVDVNTPLEPSRALVLLKDTLAISEGTLPHPKALQNIIDPKDRAKYEAIHYWDSIPLDTNILDDSQTFENTLVNFLGLVTSLDSDDAKETVIIPLQKSSGKVLRFILSRYFEYLYRYNSALQNQYIYQAVLEWSIENPKLRQSERDRASELLQTIRRNLVGSKAEDFDYVGLDGVKRKLSRGFAPMTLLIFFNPNCHVCQHEALSISNNKELEDLTKRNKLDILFIYIGNDITELQSNIEMLPRFAKIGMASENLIAKGIYDIQAVPTIYLLGTDRKVLLRDCRLGDAIKYIQDSNK